MQLNFSPSAKDLARKLLNALSDDPQKTTWRSQRYADQMVLTSGEGRITHDANAIDELIKADLVRTIGAGETTQYILRPSLRYAVTNDFALPDLKQSFATVTVNPSNISASFDGRQVADALEQALGADFLHGQMQLRLALEGLRSATATTREKALGKVIAQLGSSVQNGASPITVLQALVSIAPHMAHGF